MKLRKRAAYIIGFIVLVIFLAVGVLIVEKRKTPHQILKIMPDHVDLQVKNVHYTDVGESGIKLDIKADRARYVKKENLALFEKISIKLIMKNGKTFLMAGDKGQLETKTKDMTVSGNVKIISDNGDCFMTDDLKYSNADKRIFTDSVIIMENPRMKIRGRGMFLSLKDEQLSLLSKVKAQVR